MKKQLGVLVAAVSLASATPAGAQTSASDSGPEGLAALGSLGELNFFAGVRIWANEWDIVTFKRVLSADVTPTLRDELDITTSNLEITPMPTFGVRYGNLLASLTYFVPTSYNGNGGLEQDVERREIDLNVGYYVLPSVVVSLAYKEAKVDRLIDYVASEQKIKGILLGVSASAPLSDRLSLYGNFAYGFGRQKSQVADASGDTKYSARYTISEVGISYRIMEGSAGAFIKSVSGSLGYRAQSYTTKDVALGTYDPSAPSTPLSITTRDGRTSTTGAVLAIVASF
jgi:hypothetical protein